jgi:sugar O-acyltransferase (sialic acid O-acetyltransferase NeuD family)
MNDIVIFGAGQTAEIVSHYFINDSNFNVVAYTVHSEFINEPELLGCPVVPFEDIENLYSPNEYGMFVAASYTNINQLREKMYHDAKNKNYKLVSYVSTKANSIANIECGDNCFILENEIIQPFARIGNNVFVWGGVLIGHHAIIEDHCWLTAGSSIGGNTKINARTFLGINCTIGHLIEIGRDNFIGANGLITKNTEDKSVYIMKDTQKFILDSDRFILISKMS